MDLRLEHEYLAESVAVIRLVGELDVYTSAKLRELVIGVVDAGYYRLVIDLARVTGVDSTGLGVLVGTLKRCRAHNGGVVLVIVTKHLARVSRITGLYRVFPIFNDSDSASAAFAAETLPGPGFHPDSDHFRWVPFAKVYKGVLHVLKDGS